PRLTRNPDRSSHPVPKTQPQRPTSPGRRSPIRLLFPLASHSRDSLNSKLKTQNSNFPSRCPHRFLPAPSSRRTHPFGNSTERVAITGLACQGFRAFARRSRGVTGAIYRWWGKRGALAASSLSSAFRHGRTGDGAGVYWGG